MSSSTLIGHGRIPSNTTKKIATVVPTRAPRQFITIEQASAWLCTPVATIRDWILKRKVTAYRPGMHVLLDLAELEALVMSSARPAIMSSQKGA